MENFEIGSKAILKINWLSQTGETPTSILDTNITIKEYDTSTSTWSNLITSQPMINISDSIYYYEFDTSSSDLNTTYLAIYEATVDGLNVSATEEFIVYESYAKRTDVNQLLEGNVRYDFTIASIEVAARNLKPGMLDNMTIITKEDSASDWSTPVSSKTVYFWYDLAGNCIARKEEN